MALPYASGCALLAERKIGEMGMFELSASEQKLAAGDDRVVDRLRPYDSGNQRYR